MWIGLNFVSAVSNLSQAQLHSFMELNFSYKMSVRKPKEKIQLEDKDTDVRIMLTYILKQQ